MLIQSMTLFAYASLIVTICLVYFEAIHILVPGYFNFFTQTETTAIRAISMCSELHVFTHS